MSAIEPVERFPDPVPEPFTHDNSSMAGSRYSASVSDISDRLRSEVSSEPELPTRRGARLAHFVVADQLGARHSRSAQLDVPPEELSPQAMVRQRALGLGFSESSIDTVPISLAEIAKHAAVAQGARAASEQARRAPTSQEVSVDVAPEVGQLARAMPREGVPSWHAQEVAARDAWLARGNTDSTVDMFRPHTPATAIPPTDERPSRQ